MNDTLEQIHKVSLELQAMEKNSKPEDILLESEPKEDIVSANEVIDKLFFSCIERCDKHGYILTGCSLYAHGHFGLAPRQNIQKGRLLVLF